MNAAITSVGELRERITVEANTPTRDTVGQLIPSWAAFSGDGKLWARAEFLSGRELEIAQKIATEVSMRFWVRYRTDLSEKMRINWRSQYWNIAAILPAESKDFMLLMASRTN